MGYKSKFKGSTVEERLRAVLKKQDTLVSGVNIKAIGGESVLDSGNLDILYQPIPYQFLLDLRGKGKLKPGQFYRITDYVTTTSQANTRSAGKLFDVIVLALTNDTFAERAWACHRDGSTDFQNSHLEAWQIWYCLDNDTSRFDWVFPTSGGGKGVIYRMIDEFGNDCPYDFKNIQFYRQWDSSRSSWSIISSSNIGTPCYTFSSSGNGSTTSFTDMSLLASNKIYSNVIGKYVDIYNRQNLNNICFFGGECSSNTFGAIVITIPLKVCAPITLLVLTVMAIPLENRVLTLPLETTVSIIPLETTVGVTPSETTVGILNLQQIVLYQLNTTIINTITLGTDVSILSLQGQRQHLHLLKYRITTSPKDCKVHQMHTLA